MAAARDSHLASIDLDEAIAALLVAGNAELLVDALHDPDRSSGALRALAAARGLEVVVGELLGPIVARARSTGHTWAEIGDALGVTRQAVIQRFGKPGEHREQEGEARPVDEAASRASRLLDSFLQGRFEAVRADFDERMKMMCSIDVLRSARQRMDRRSGELLRTARPTVALHQGYTVVDVLLVLERDRRTARVVFRPDGRVAGFFVLDDSGSSPA